MKDPNLAILNAYKTALTGMSFNGTDVPVYSRFAPLSSIPKKYVLISSQTKIENKTKCGYWWECIITINVVAKYPNGNGDISFPVVIGQEIEDRVQATPLTLDDFSIRQVKQLETTEVNFPTATEDIYQYIIPFYHKINRAA